MNGKWVVCVCLIELLLLLLMVAFLCCDQLGEGSEKGRGFWVLLGLEKGS